MKKRVPLAALLLLVSLARAADPNAAVDPAQYKAPVKVACVGDSITFGLGLKAGENYPTQLGKMLGSKWDVKNFGVNSTTLLKNGDKPYIKDPACKASLAFGPDVVIIMLGTNDVKAVNWAKKEQFTADYKALIETYAALETKPRIFVCRPVPVANDGKWGITEPGMAEQAPLIAAAIKDENTGSIDMHAALDPSKNLFAADNVHPNAAGAMLLAQTAYKALTGKDYAAPTATAAARP